MRKLIFLFVITAVVMSCSSDPEYLVRGTLEGSDECKIYLQKRESGQFARIDSAVVEDGVFQISGGSVDYPRAYYLSVEGKRGYLMFFLENTDITITAHSDSLYNAEVTGSVTHSEYITYSKGLEPLYERNNNLFKQAGLARYAGDTEKAAGIDSVRELVFEEIHEYSMEYIKSNPSSFCIPVILRSVSSEMSGDELETCVNQLDARLMQSQIIVDLKEKVEKLKKVATGEVAPDFTQDNPDGIPVSLSEMIGPDLLLVYFWASWCGECRQENHNVLALYKEFHDIGFDVLGVSLDRERDNWMQAISEDELEWTNISDLGYWNNEAADLYAVSSIPAGFLLDPEGRILAGNLEGDDLRKTVSGILGHATDEDR